MGVLIHAGSVCAKAHIFHQGRSLTPLQEAACLLNWLENHLTSITTEHVLGVSSIKVDWLSCQDVLQAEWSILPLVFEQIVARFGQPCGDLCATEQNKVSSFF